MRLPPLGAGPQLRFARAAATATMGVSTEFMALVVLVVNVVLVTVLVGVLGYVAWWEAPRIRAAREARRVADAQGPCMTGVWCV